MKAKEDREWFECWFDSPYYHVLYKERDEKEAHAFLDSLISFLKPVSNARILDVACGKGRHSIYLNKKGFEVTGFDLSTENIEHDLHFSNSTLSFFRHDMREVFRDNYFDYVFNLFSSFGYFEKETDNAKTIFAHAKALKQGGILVIDYMNSSKVKRFLCAREEKIINGIKFKLKKKVRDGKIVKEISFTDNNKDYYFAERLSLFYKKDFEKYFAACGLQLLNTFGDYTMNDFDEKNSERLILVCRK